MFQHAYFIQDLLCKTAQHYMVQFVYFSVPQKPKFNPVHLIFEVSRSQTIRHRNPVNNKSTHHRHHYLHNTQQTQDTNIHALSRIWTHDPSNQVAVVYSYAMQTSKYFIYISICLFLCKFSHMAVQDYEG
jgi:hypothetical protein